MLWLVPTARTIAFTPGRRAIDPAQAVLLAFLLTGLYLIIDGPIQALIDGVLPGTRFGAYPSSHGVLHSIDMTFGLALVAYQEELVFRRCARAVFGKWLGDGLGMIVATSLLFGAYHWWSGIGNVATAALFGLGSMSLYRRAAVLWPVVLSHYLVDLAGFA